MKRKSLYFIILTFLVSNALPAQPPQFVLPLPDSSDTQSVTQSSSVSKPSGQFELLDLTGDSLVLGYLALKDGGNERQAIVTPVNKNDWLIAVTSVSAAALAQQTNPVLYVLNDISVGRTGSGNYVRLKAAVYERGATGYTLLSKADTLVTDNARDISSIGDLINTAISSTAALLNTGIVQRPSGKALTREEVNIQEKEKYAFISKSVNPTGIYMSYEEFKAGKPSFEKFFLKTDTVGKTIEVNSFTEMDSTLRPVIPWAIGVNNELYVYSDNKLFPVEAVGNNLVFSKFIDPETRKNNASFWRMTVGENLSGKYANIFDNTNTLTLSNYHGKGLSGDAVKVNADTGAPEF